MFCGYQDREELEDDLYGKEDQEDSQGSEVDSELEFRLYSQLHYASNNGEREEEENGGGEEGKTNNQQLPPEEEEDITGEEEEKRTIPRKTSRSQEMGLQGHKAPRQKNTYKEAPSKPKKKTKADRNVTLLKEEVIVIDSGTDVITVSDSEESTCALKGQRSKKPTPVKAVPLAPKWTKKRKRSPSPEVVVLDSQEDSSEEEEVEEELETSDSDGLESWMILGKGNQDGDTSISLNVEGVDHGSDADGAEAGERVWTVSSRDRDAQIYNRSPGQPVARRPSSRYYTEKNVTCRSCSKTGHLSKNCPTPRKELSCLQCGASGHMMAGCPETLCVNCGLPGHLYRDCRERAYWYKKCHRCGMVGHFHDACPEIWRQYHITVTLGPPKLPKTEVKGRDPPYCSNCSRKGHFGFECSQRRMFNGTYPCTPFINVYDTTEELRRRNVRLQHRVKEMQEAGTFPSESQAPPTPQAPPRKKQKTNGNNNHTPNHSNFNHKQKTNNQVRLGEGRRGYASTPTTKMAARELPKKSGEKPWKPKWKPRPKENDGTPGVVTVMEEDTDFSRGGGRGEVEGKAAAATKKKKKTKKKNKEQKAGPGSAGAPFQPTRHVPDRLFSAGASMQTKRIKFRARGRERKAAHSAAADMYPTDENLFTIKQKKRNR